MKVVRVALAMIIALALLGPAVAQQQPPFALGAASQAPTMTVADLRKTGVRSVKIVADWSVIEAHRGTFTWAETDAAVRRAFTGGLQPVVVVAFTPRWATLSTAEDLRNPAVYTRTPPRNVADWERFVFKAAARYRHRVTDIQVWTVADLPYFRGTAAEYLALVAAAGRAAARADRTIRIVLASPAGIDLLHVKRAVSQAPGAVAVVSLTPQSLAPEQWLRPLAVLRTRVLTNPARPLWVEWTAADQRSPGATVRAAAVARAADIERLFLAPDHLQALDDRVRAVLELLEALPYTGYLSRADGVYAVVLGTAERSALIAWSDPGLSRSIEVQVIPPAKIFGVDGTSPTVDPQQERITLPLGPVPVVVQGLSPAILDEAALTLRQRGPLLPVVPGILDFANAPQVTARLGASPEQSGLYNVLRTRANGALQPVEVGGEQALRTNASQNVVFAYFDVDDTFLFFNDGRYTVEVAVEVLRAQAAGTVGFNVFYDSQVGYRFTPWQVVEAGQGWVTYTFRLSDANFANTWGWDFAINAGGNRTEDLTIRSVTVRKIPR